MYGCELDVPPDHFPQKTGNPSFKEFVFSIKYMIHRFLLFTVNVNRVNRVVKGKTRSKEKGLLISIVCVTG